MNSNKVENIFKSLLARKLRWNVLPRSCKKSSTPSIFSIKVNQTSWLLVFQSATNNDSEDGTESLKHRYIIGWTKADEDEKIMASDSSTEPKTWLGNSKQNEMKKPKHDDEKLYLLVITTRKKMRETKSFDTNWRLRQSKKINKRSIFSHNIDLAWISLKSSESRSDFDVTSGRHQDNKIDIISGWNMKSYNTLKISYVKIIF